jgi:hypothetical protein
MKEINKARDIGRKISRGKGRERHRERKRKRKRG